MSKHPESTCAIMVFISVSLLLSSCVEPGSFSIIRANRLYRSGFTHEAAATYLKVGAGDNPIASYNMANFFLLQGEGDAAMAMFEVAIASGQGEIVARSWYNIGLSSYVDGDYADAATSFKKALLAYVDSGIANQKHSRSPDDKQRREMARAYELAIRAQEERRDAGATERGRYGSGSASGDLQPFSLSRTDEKTLFAPGEATSTLVEDQ